jgi:hypothetical protein
MRRMPTSDLLISGPGEIQAVIAKTATTSGDDAPRIDISDFDLIPLSQLLCLFSGQTWDVAILDSFPIIEEQSVNGPWIHRLPDELVKWLSTLQPADLDGVAMKWSQTEELQEMEDRQPGITLEVVVAITRLARKAVDEGKHLYLWSSL